MKKITLKIMRSFKHSSGKKRSQGVGNGACGFSRSARGSPGVKAAAGGGFNSRVTEKAPYVLGEELARFEIAFAQYCGVEFALGVGNGLDALVLILRALGMAQGMRSWYPARLSK